MCTDGSSGGGAPPVIFAEGVSAGGESSQDTSVFLNCNFRVLSQLVYISNINFHERSFSVYTELSLVPIHPEQRELLLNIGCDAYLPNELPEGSGGRVTVNDEDAVYLRRDPFHVLGQKCEQSLRVLSSQMYEVLEDSEGELRIIVPESCYDSMDEQMVIKVGIDVKVINPRHGIHFVASFGKDNVLEKGAHVYTMRSNVISSTRSWLPCMDAPDQLCLWRIEITVDASLIAIASGELLHSEYSLDMREVTYHYQLLIPTSAVNIGFVVGHFTPYVHPEMSEITAFALPSLTSLVKHTTSTVDRVFEFFEELLSCRFPFPSYKQVFVDQAAEAINSFSGLTVLSVTVLYHKKILDCVQETRQLLARAVAEQFFGCYVSAAHWLDFWLMKSLSKFFTGLFIERYFGTAEYLFQVMRTLNAVCNYESKWGMLVLRPLKNDPKNKFEWHFDPRNPFTCSPLYANVLFKKGHLIIRMLNKRLGKEPFFQVVQKILSVTTQFSQKQTEPKNWQHMTVSTESFFRTVSNVTGQELPTFLEQWIYGGGHANFEVEYSFNRKRNMIELEIKQDPKGSLGRQSYVGPVTVVVQELDGSFVHTIQIDTDHSTHDLQCHSKGRRQKKKKIPLSTGEELEIDLTNMDLDSPVLWVRIDPDLLLLREINIHQPVYQWEYMLKYERDVLAQLQALEILERFPSPHVRSVILEAIETESFFYRVRCRAAFAHSEVVNKLSEIWLGPPALLTLFKKLYGCKSAPHMPKPNNFVVTTVNLELYFLMQALPHAMGCLRTSSNTAFTEVREFLLGLILYNDNSVNRYSDDHYRASLIRALAATLVPVDNLGDNASPDSLNLDMERTLAEFTHALNMDTLKPSFGYIIGINALRAIYQMQVLGHLPLDPKVFYLFAQPGNYTPLRLAALGCLVDMVHNCKISGCFEILSNLLDTCVNDVEPAVRYHLATLLCSEPPFFIASQEFHDQVRESDAIAVAQRLWSVITEEKTESQLRNYFIDLWFLLYGTGVPSFLKSEAPSQPVTRREFRASFNDVLNTVEMLGSSSWHNTILTTCEPNCNTEVNPAEMTDDMLQ
uniref:Transcription initiation factor TFIID subunit 2 n=1 Tax=Syphacia muris TaxID=451379 RepID=A0A0N5A862_9BILA